jgi:hypothetical protein
MLGVKKPIVEESTPSFLPIVSMSSCSLGASITPFTPKLGAIDKKIDAEINKKAKAMAKKRGI